MGDHFVLLVDRLLTESTLEATIESRSQSLAGQIAVEAVDNEPDNSPRKINVMDGSQNLKLVECRICQDEDLESNMEIPCSCCGSLKYAHRKCVQRWCNEKGDTVCEICLQQFKPGYTAPPLFHYGGIPMNFRGIWEISRRDLHNPRFLAMVATDRSLADMDYDYYSASNTRRMWYCRSVAAIFMILLVLRHTLPIIISGEDVQYSLAEFMLLMLRIGGILLPVYIMVRSLVLFHRRRRQQEYYSSTSEGGSEQQQHSLPWIRSEPHFIGVH